jgi:hypothetical protein
VLEITADAKTDTWHPHLHCVTNGSFLPQAELADEWERCTGDSRIVDIRYVGNSDGAAGYVTKYITKPVPSAFYDTPSMLEEAMRAVKGVKQLISFGLWRKIRFLKPMKNDDWKTIGHWNELAFGATVKCVGYETLIVAIRDAGLSILSGEFTIQDLWQSSG